MKLWIICSGQSSAQFPDRLSSAEFDALCRAEPELGLRPGAEEKSSAANGRRIYAGPAQTDLETARLIFPDGEISRESLLAPVQCRAFKDTEEKLPLWRWRMMAKLQRRLGSPRQPESDRALSARADALAESLRQQEEDCVLVCHASFVAPLLDSLRRQGCCYSRSGIFRYAPFERILVTGRNLHCGGCSHNCLLTNPGCGVGRDKAARKSQ